MAEYLSPGVYVEEFDSGFKPMEGVSTSTAGFIGMTERGPAIGAPTLVTSFMDFKRKFGGYLSEVVYGDNGFLPISVEQFFINGGARAYISRVVADNAKTAGNGKGGPLSILAANPGSWGNKLDIKIFKTFKGKTQILSGENGKYLLKLTAGMTEGDTVCFFENGKEAGFARITNVADNFVWFDSDAAADFVDDALLPKKTVAVCAFRLEARYGEVDEAYDNLSLNPLAVDYIAKRLGKSELMKIEFDADKAYAANPINVIAGSEEELSRLGIALSGGSDGSVMTVSPGVYIGEDNGPNKRTGIQAFIENSNVSIMAVPGITDLSVQLSLVNHCERLGSRFAILDIPKDTIRVNEVAEHKSVINSSYAAVYHPWLYVYNAGERKNTAVPPSGAMAGIYARSDTVRGVQKAPANEIVAGCVGLYCTYNKGEQDILNPLGVNLIRSFPGQGIKVWGARTCSSDASWKYINVRRLFIFIEESIKANTNWVVFEPNNEVLWARVGRTISVFLSGMWRGGALAGASETDAFFVNIGRDTMSEDDIANGRLVCVIGVAPVKPAEFVIFRITQKTESETAAAE